MLGRMKSTLQLALLVPFVLAPCLMGCPEKQGSSKGPAAQSEGQSTEASSADAPKSGEEAKSGHTKRDAPPSAPAPSGGGW
jgi:hypothetical protein